ncbi:MAG: 50S ribosomal protein L5 [Chlamydiae bacterium RIFCSPHIGHO2_12_FULL_49_11]|nr:MAG: 50S ribosomal protein L5 [Chlamydiae bacterium RIFCSPHIGHO2_12_FULL_49_11]
MTQAQLKQHYKESVVGELQQRFGYGNLHEVPELKKIVISMGLAKATKDKKHLDACHNDLMQIAGQKPIFIRSTKSISNFKLREDQIIGLKVTLRGSRMYDFLYRFQHIVAPRIPDFRGLKLKGDGRGSLSFGLKEQSMFPEVDLDKIAIVQGMNITFVTTAQSDEECIALLRMLGLPLKKS